MKVIYGSKKLKGNIKYPVLTLGNFDGVHKGHQKILKLVMGIAKRHGGTGILYTFDPHPVKILAPELSPLLLQTMDQKIEILNSLGLGMLIIEPFTKGLAGLSAESFFDKIIVKRIRAKEIVIGYDFTFGQHRTGKAEEIEKMAASKGIKTHVVDAVFSKESLLSSTHIRHYVERGEMLLANAMLGRPYAMEGRVVKGLGIGAELGFHTANLKTENEIIPPPGVYITATTLKKTGKRYRSVTNIGYNPTVGGTMLAIETHLLNFKGDLLGQKMKLELFKKIRREITFETMDSLREQITKDISVTRKYYEKVRP